MNKSIMVYAETSSWRGRARTATICLILLIQSVWFVFYQLSMRLKDALSSIPGYKDPWRGINSLTVFIVLYLSFLIVLRPFTAALEDKTDNWLEWSGGDGLLASTPWRKWFHRAVGTVLAFAMAFLWLGPTLLRAVSSRGIAQDQMEFLINLLRNWNGALWVIAFSLALGWLSQWRKEQCLEYCARLQFPWCQSPSCNRPRHARYKGLDHQRRRRR